MRAESPPTSLSWFRIPRNEAEPAPPSAFSRPRKYGSDVDRDVFQRRRDRVDLGRRDTVPVEQLLRAGKIACGLDHEQLVRQRADLVLHLRDVDRVAASGGWGDRAFLSHPVPLDRIPTTVCL